MRPRVWRKPFARPLQSQCRLSSFCSRVFSPALFLCPVPRGIPRCFFVLFPAVFRAVSLFCSPRYSAVFFLLFPGIGCRLFFVLCPSLYLGPCFYSAGCYPAFSYVFSPASGAGVLPPLWRGRVLPFTVQSRDHLATITDIYVPSFLRPVRGSLDPRLLSSIPPDDKLLHGTKNHTLRQIFIFHFINLSMLFFDYFFHKDIEIYELRFTA